MSHCTPHTTCTWGDPAACSGCGIQGQLACRWDKKILAGFHGIAWPALATAVFGMVPVGLATGVWWTLIGYVAYFFLMLGVLEIRFLCSHCRSVYGFSFFRWGRPLRGRLCSVGNPLLNSPTFGCSLLWRRYMFGHSLGFLRGLGSF